MRNACQAEASNTDNIYFGTYYGIYHSEDGGITTQLKNAGLMNSYIYDLEVHPVNSEIVYAGGLLGLWKSTDGCRNWQQIMDESIMHIKYNPVCPDTLYLGGGSKLLRSFNGGSTFENIDNDITGGITSISINPKHSNIVFVTSGVVVYKSTDYGDTWTHVFTSHNYETYTEIQIDPFYPDTIYFGMHRSIDGGISWEENALDYRIDGIHPQNTDILYGSSFYANDIYVSYDWGNNFQLMAEYLNGPFPGQNIRSFTIAKDDPDYLFYCTLNDGIHYSTDAGENWQKIEGNYENRTLDVIPFINENKYYIATHGDGVWVYDTNYVNTINDNLFIKDNNYLQVFPNPAQDKTRITYKIEQSSKITICIFDIHGRLISTLINENKTQGEHEIKWKAKDKNGKELNSGLYFVRLQSGSNIQTKRLILIK